MPELKVIRSANRKTSVQPPAYFAGVEFSDNVMHGSAPDKLFAPLRDVGTA
jgi:hypothetical protein